MAMYDLEEEQKNAYMEIVRNFGIPEEVRFLFEHYVYEGCVFNNMTPPESLKAIREWETREDQWRTHWILEIVLLILARGQLEKIERSKMRGATFEMLSPVEFKVPTHELIAEMESPRFVTTHLPWQFLPKQLTEQKRGKIVYIMRNPKDIVGSINRLISSGEEKDERLWKYFMNSFLRGGNIYGHSYCSWFDHVEEYWKNRGNENVFFASYEGMKKDLQSVLTPLSTFILDEELDDETKTVIEEYSTVKEMKKSYDQIEKSRPDGVIVTRALGKSPFIKKGVVGSWKDLFTVAESEMFDEVCRERMSDCGFEITYD